MLEIYDKLEFASGSNERLRILKDLPPLLVQGFVYAFHPEKIYGATSRSFCKERVVSEEDVYADEEVLPIFFHILDLLASGKLKGASAEIALRNISVRMSDLQRKWCARILNGNMRCGVGWGLFCSVHKGLLKGFRAQLCGTYRGQSLQGDWLVEPKLDGMRVYAVFEGTRGTAYSRSGKSVPGAQKVLDEISRYEVLRDVVLDGEMVNLGKNSRFLSISQARRSGGSKEGLVFAVFDTIPLEFWQRRCDIPLFTRKKTLLDLTKSLVEDGVGIVYPIAGNYQSCLSKELIREQTGLLVDSGYEGAVIKRAESPYVFGRTDDWLKVKFHESGDFKVVDILRGSGRLSDTCGRLIVDVDGVRVGVGSGLSDKDRDYFWKNKDSLKNKVVVEVRHEGKTPDGSLNFPRFVRVRRDK